MKVRNYFLIFVVIFVYANSLGAEKLWTESTTSYKELPQTISPETFVKISDEVNPAVVNISTTKLIKGKGVWPHKFFYKGPKRKDEDNNGKNEPFNPFEDFFGERFFDYFFGLPPQGDIKQQSLGSGFIINKEGYIVTNAHVIEQATEIKVTLSDDSEYNAEIIGKDVKTDVALIKIKPTQPISIAILGDSNKLRVGDIVVAIGNPFGLSHSVTQGIVSAKERSIGFGNYDDYIQTDASINPGNSGGPLINLYGEVIGINTAIVATGQGIGFAIPINTAKSIIQQLKDKGKVVRGWLGVYIQKITQDLVKSLSLESKQGALVSEVLEDSPAGKAGVKRGDIIVKFDGKDIKDFRELPMIVAETPVGKKVQIEVIRDKERKVIEVEIGELKDDEIAEASENDETELLGISVQTLTPELAESLGFDKKLKGVVISDINRDSRAYEEGLRRGDVILEINKKTIEDLNDYLKATKNLKKGDSIVLLIKRAKGTFYVAFTL